MTVGKHLFLQRSFLIMLLIVVTHYSHFILHCYKLQEVIKGQDTTETQVLTPHD